MRLTAKRTRMPLCEGVPVPRTLEAEGQGELPEGGVERLGGGLAKTLGYCPRTERNVDSNVHPMLRFRHLTAPIDMAHLLRPGS